MNPFLKQVADSPDLAKALRELLEKQFEAPKDMDTSTSDIELGQFLRARLAGMKAIDEAFKEIARHRTGSEPSERVHPGR